MGSFLFFEAFREINTPYYERETISSNGRAADKSVGCWFKSNIVSLLFFENYLISERRYFMLTKKEKKALDLLLRMKGSRNFIEFVYDSILLNRVKMMGLSPYALMHKVAIKEE